MIDEKSGVHAVLKEGGDELSGDISIRANIDTSGLSVSGKSRALAALDRLIGGVVGIPAALSEGIRARIEIKNSNRAAIIRAEGRRALRALEAEGEPGNIILERVVAEETRKQINREAVAAETITAILELPQPTGPEPTNECPELAEDWIDIFASHAEKASSEQLRQLWGRVLAGEIRKPSSFAPSTLRVISEMDVEIASAFQEVARLRVNESAVLKPDPFTGELLIKWVFLEEVGLLQEVNSNLHLDLSGSDGDFSFINTKKYCLLVKFNEKIRKIRFPIVRVTRVGQQIASILPWDEVDALRVVSGAIKENVRIEIGEIVERQGDAINYHSVEIIRNLCSN